MDIFKKGQTIHVLIYQGDSQTEADSLLGFLERARLANSPIPIGTSGIGVQIQHVDGICAFDFNLGKTIYKVIIEGELV